MGNKIVYSKDHIKKGGETYRLSYVYDAIKGRGAFEKLSKTELEQLCRSVKNSQVDIELKVRADIKDVYTREIGEDIYEDKFIGGDILNALVIDHYNVNLINRLNIISAYKKSAYKFKDSMFILPNLGDDFWTNFMKAGMMTAIQLLETKYSDIFSSGLRGENIFKSFGFGLDKPVDSNRYGPQAVWNQNELKGDSQMFITFIKEAFEIAIIKYGKITDPTFSVDKNIEKFGPEVCILDTEKIERHLDILRRTKNDTYQTYTKIVNSWNGIIIKIRSLSRKFIDFIDRYYMLEFCLKAHDKKSATQILENLKERSKNNLQLITSKDDLAILSVINHLTLDHIISSFHTSIIDELKHFE